MTEKEKKYRRCRATRPKTGERCIKRYQHEGVHTAWVRQKSMKTQLVEFEEQPVRREGYVYVCMACGKRSYDLYGEEAITPGWDVACTMNCLHVPEDRVVVDEKTGRVKEILTPEEKRK